MPRSEKAVKAHEEHKRRNQKLRDKTTGPFAGEVNNLLDLAEAGYDEGLADVETHDGKADKHAARRASDIAAIQKEGDKNGGKAAVKLAYELGVRTGGRLAGAAAALAD